jgi:hypothetical protein
MKKLLSLVFILITLSVAMFKFNQNVGKELEQPLQKIALRKSYSQKFQQELEAIQDKSSPKAQKLQKLIYRMEMENALIEESIAIPKITKRIGITGWFFMTFSKDRFKKLEQELHKENFAISTALCPKEFAILFKQYINHPPSKGKEEKDKMMNQLLEMVEKYPHP